MAVQTDLGAVVNRLFNGTAQSELYNAVIYALHVEPASESEEMNN